MIAFVFGMLLHPFPRLAYRHILVDHKSLLTQHIIYCELLQQVRFKGVRCFNAPACNLFCHNSIFQKEKRHHISGGAGGQQRR